MVENASCRYKTILGRGLRSRGPEGQRVEAKERGKPHEYAEILEGQRNQYRDGYLRGLREKPALHRGLRTIEEAPGITSQDSHTEGDAGLAPEGIAHGRQAMGGTCDAPEGRRWWEPKG